MRAPLVICQTRHGFICASAGVDQSNTPEEGTLVLLPLDPDGSAAQLRDELRERTGCDVGVIVTDSFGRPWRQGTTDVAIGAAGIEVLQELSGDRDPIGYELKATVIAIADEIAGAAQLVSGKLDRIPVDDRARSRHSRRPDARRTSRSRRSATCSVRVARVSDDPIAAANAVLREKGYAERDLAVHAGPRGKALLKGNRIISPFCDDASLVLRVVRELIPAGGELGAKLLRPSELRARLQE